MKKKPIYEYLDFVEYYNDVPLYQYDGKSLFFKLTKEEFIKKFKGFNQVKLFGVFKIKKDGIFRIKSEIRFILNNEYVTDNSTNPGVDEIYKQGYYKFEFIFNTNIVQEYDIVQISINNDIISNPNLKDEILFSDIYFFEVTDTKMEIPLVNPYRTKGTTLQRPSNVQIGFTYKDTDLNKWIIWNGEAWENIDGTALG